MSVTGRRELGNVQLFAPVPHLSLAIHSNLPMRQGYLLLVFSKFSPIICSCYVQSPMLVPWELKRCVNRPRTQRTIHSFNQWINQRRGEKRTVLRVALAKLKVRKQNICEGFAQLLSVGLTELGYPLPLFLFSHEQTWTGLSQSQLQGSFLAMSPRASIISGHSQLHFDLSNSHFKVLQFT